MDIGATHKFALQCRPIVKFKPAIRAGGGRALHCLTMCVQKAVLSMVTIDPSNGYLAVGKLKLADRRTIPVELQTYFRFCTFFSSRFWEYATVPKQFCIVIGGVACSQVSKEGR